MLPEIEGVLIPNGQWCSFVFERVLQYYDGPRLTLQRSRAGQLYLAWWSDSDGRTERWVFLPLSEPRLHDILSGHVPSLEGLSNPEDGYLLVADIDSDSGAVVRTSMTEAAALPSDSLPLEGARLSIPVPEDISRLPTRDRAHTLDVLLLGAASDETGRFGAKVVAQVIGNIQRLVDALGQVKSEVPTRKGGISTEVLTWTRLDLVSTYAGSLGLRFETNQEDDMFSRSLTRSSLEGLYDLIEVSDRLDGLTSQLSVLRTRVAKRYSDFLSTIGSSVSEASLRWSQPGNARTREFTITRESAQIIVEQIAIATSKIEDNLSLEGILVAGNMRTLRFEFKTLEHDERYDGQVHEDAVSELELIPLSSTCTITLQPNLEISAVTGEEETTYTLLSIKRL